MVDVVAAVVDDQEKKKKARCQIPTEWERNYI